LKNINKIGRSLLILLSLTGCDIFYAAVERSVEQTQTEKEVVEPKATSSTSSRTQSTTLIRPTPTILLFSTNEPCTSAKSMPLDQMGESIEVCGKVTYVGEEQCPNCPNGFYSYLLLDNNFYILSYDWVFFPEWTGNCIKVKDKLESFGSKPAFVFGKGEGYDGSKCEYLPDGTLSCSEGDYFQPYSGCK